MLKIIMAVVGLIAIAAGAVVAYAAATQPDEFRIKRSLFIKAPPDKIQSLVNDFRAWGAWSPWEHKDPAMKRTFSAPSGGQGARYAWEGNSEVGSGEMVMVEASSERTKLDMHFKSPMEANNIAEFTFVPERDGTNVTWSMYGASPLISKVMCVFLDMDKMVGSEFEKGLAALKTKAENAS